MNKVWDKIAKMFIAVESGLAKKLSNTIDGYKVTVYSMGEGNPVTRIDIKKED